MNACVKYSNMKIYVHDSMCKEVWTFFGVQFYNEIYSNN